MLNITQNDGDKSGLSKLLPQTKIWIRRKFKGGIVS